MRNRRDIVYIGAFILMTVGLVVVTGGNAGAAIVPVILVLFLFLIISLPMRYSLTALFAITLLFHAYSDNAMVNYWEGPLSIFKRLLYTNLRHYTGIPIMKFNAYEAAFGLVVIMMTVRTFMGNNIDRHKALPAAKPMKTAAFVSLGAVFLSVVWGLARGGSQFDQTVFQIRSIFWFPFVLMTSMRAFKTERDFVRLGIVLGVVCVLRILEGLYFYFFIALPQGLRIDYVMTHDDTVWLVALMAILISAFLETLTMRSLLRLIFLGGLVMYAILINQRRIAYVSLVLSVAMMTAFVRMEVRRWLIRIALVFLPLIILYVIAGMNSSAAIFSPVHNIVSVNDDKDGSNWSRNVENYNLVETLRANPVLGTGWGHGYKEILFSYDLSGAMPTYRHHPHNSLLGLLASTGALGLFLIWIYLPVGVFLASRAYMTASNPIQRVTAMSAISIVIIYMIQAYGDMGRESGDIGVVLGAALGCVANLVRETDGLRTLDT